MPALQLVIELDDKGSVKRVENLDRQFDHLTRSVQSGSVKIAAGWQRMHTSMSGIATRLSRISMVAKIALAGFATAAIVTGARFEQSMANVASVAGATDQELLQLSNTARFWGKQTAFSANEAADAMYSLASAGMNNIQIQNAVGGVLKFAGATATGLGEAAEQTVQALKMFEFQADQTERVVNIFAAGISASSLTAERLADSMGYVGGTAKAVGMSIEETVGALANLHNAGLMGMRAGTGLKNILAIISENGPKLSRVLGGMSLETNSLADIMGHLSARGTTANEIFDIFGRETAPAVLAMMTAGKAGMDAMTTAVTGTNKAAEMYDKQMATIQNRMKIFKSAIQENMIAAYDALKPAISGALDAAKRGFEKLTPYILGAVKAFSDFVMQNSEGIKAAAVFAAKLLTVVVVAYTLAKVIGFVTTAVHIMTGSWMIAAGAISLFRIGAVAALFNVQMAMELFKAIMVRNWAIVHLASIGPWGILIAVAGAVLAALVIVAVKNMDHIKAAFRNVGEFVVTVSNKIRDIHERVFNWIGDKASWLGNAIQEAFRKPFDWVWEKLQWLAEKAGWLMDQIVPGFTEKMNEIRGVVVDNMAAAAGAVGAGVSTAVDATGRAAVAVGGALGSAAQATGHGFAVAFDYVKDKAGDMVDTVKGKIPDLKAMIAGALGDLKALGAGLEMSMPTVAGETAKPPAELDFSAQMLADHAAYLQKEQAMNLAAWQGGIKTRLDMQKAAALEAVAYEAVSTSNWLAAKQTLAAMEMSERVNKENATAAQIAEARIAYSAAVRDAELEHNEAVWEAWLARNVEMQVLIAGLSSAYDTMVNTALDKEMSGKKRREAIWKSMSTSFLRTTGDMLKKSFAMHIRNIVVTSATEEGINVKRKFTEAKIGAVKAYQAFASIPIIGPALGAAAAAAAFSFLIAFHKGGFVEPGDSVATVKGTAYDERIVKLQTEEFVMRRSAVRGIGRGNMEYMNATRRLPVRSVETASGRVAPSTSKGGGDTIGPLIFHISGSREDAKSIADAIEEKVIPMLENAIGRRKFSLNGAM